MHLLTQSIGGQSYGLTEDFLQCAGSWTTEAAALLSHRKIPWRFNPVAAPHNGGSWKRMINSCKHVLYLLLGYRSVTNEVLQTLFCLVEQFF